LKHSERHKRRWAGGNGAGATAAEGVGSLPRRRDNGIDNGIYMDYAASAPLKPAVVEAMLPWRTERYGNPSSVHRWGRRARHALDEAREKVAAAIGCRPSEIVFTSGGTEADNMALQGAAWGAPDGRRRIVTSAVEHPAVLNTARALASRGFDVTCVPVDRQGRVDMDALAAAVGDDVAVVSVMHANNEVGTIQPVEAIGRLCQKRGVPFHVDAVQAFGKLPVDVDRIGCSMLSLSGHKIGGPQGVGCLYVRRGTPLVPHIYGGAQERDMRAGTENVPAIVGFARAVELAVREREEEAARLERLADELTARITERIPGVRRSGSPGNRVPGLVHLVIDGVDAESLLLNLDLKGIGASSGSACAAGSLEPSHVLLAMGMSPEEARGSLRLSLGWASREEELEPVAAALQDIVERLRSRRSVSVVGGKGSARDGR